MLTFIETLNEDFSFDWKRKTEPPVIEKKYWKNEKIPDDLLYKNFIGIETKVNRVKEYNIDPKVKDDFLKKVIFISKLIGAKPDWLMAIFNHETAGQFSPKTTNGSSNGATGLIQITNTTAGGTFGIKSSELPKEPIRHLDYVYAYFYRWLGNKKISNPIDLYVLVFTPGAYNKPMSHRYSDDIVNDNPANFGHFDKKDKRYGTKLDLYKKLENGKTAFGAIYKKEKFDKNKENNDVEKLIPVEDVTDNALEIDKIPEPVQAIKKVEVAKQIFNPSTLNDFKDIFNMNLSQFKA